MKHWDSYPFSFIHFSKSRFVSSFSNKNTIALNSAQRALVALGTFKAIFPAPVIESFQ